jgi:hypothetical protein
LGTTYILQAAPQGGETRARRTTAVTPDPPDFAFDGLISARHVDVPPDRHDPQRRHPRCNSAAQLDGETPGDELQPSAGPSAAIQLIMASHTAG